MVLPGAACLLGLGFQQEGSVHDDRLVGLEPRDDLAVLEVREARLDGDGHGLVAAHREQEDAGALGVLRRYERWRKAEALPAIVLLDGIQKLYFGGNPLQSRLRQGLLGLAQASGVAKRLLMGRALGVTGEVPESVRRPPS